MKVLHVISGISRASGGPARSCQGLVAALCEAGVDAWMYSFDRAAPWVAGVRRYERDLSMETVKGFDLVHIHGIWDRRLHKIAVLCRRAGVPYVIAPRGMLEPWSLRQKWLKKRIARFLYQDRDLRAAAALHATAESEAAQFVRLGLGVPCIISPNGVNLPQAEVEGRRSVLDGCRRALFVSRMHPKKGVLELVESWGRVRPNGWVCELVYTCNGEDELAYETKVKAKVAELGLAGEFVFTGELDDERKWNAYHRADLFVLPTYSENFGIVVAEALWAGIPVITTKGTPWSSLEGSSFSGRCGWWIDLPPVESLDKALRDGLSCQNLNQMGREGTRLVKEKFSWPAVCKAMVSGYAKILANSQGV